VVGEEAEVVGEGVEVVGKEVEVVGEGVEVVGEGVRWSEVGRGVIVVVVGEGSGMRWLSEVREPHSYTKEKNSGSIHKTPQNDKACPFGCNKEISAVTSRYPWISVTSHPYPYISVSLCNPRMFIWI
jgi:hypothetical protein